MCFVRGVLIPSFRSPGPVYCLKGIPSDHFLLRFHLQLCIYTYPYYPTRLCTTQYPNDHFLTILTIKWPVFLYANASRIVSLLVDLMVSLFNIHTLLIAYHTISVHSHIIRTIDPTLCTVCMHMQCLLCTKMLKMDSMLIMVMLHYSYTHSNYCKQETNLKTKTR